MLGVAFGIAVEAILVNLIINGAQKIETLYYSTPRWSWWVAHAIFGMMLGAIGALLLRRDSSDQTQAAGAQH
jgi:H+/Cl- antiporter ClcA